MFCRAALRTREKLIFMPKERKPDLGNISRGSHAGCSTLCSSAVTSAVLDVTYCSNLCEVDIVSGLRLAKAFRGVLRLFALIRVAVDGL